MEYRLLDRLFHDLPFSLCPRAAILFICSLDEWPSLLEGSRWKALGKKVRRPAHHFAWEYRVARPSHDRPVSSRFRGLRFSIRAHRNPSLISSFELSQLNFSFRENPRILPRLSQASQDLKVPKISMVFSVSMVFFVYIIYVPSGPPVPRSTRLFTFQRAAIFHT